MQHPELLARNEVIHYAAKIHKTLKHYDALKVAEEPLVTRAKQGLKEERCIVNARRLNRRGFRRSR